MGIAAGSVVLHSNKLTPRERDVMGCVAHGKKVRDISDSMGVSVNTVKFHLKNIYAKLGADSRREAMHLYQHQSLPGCRLD